MISFTVSNMTCGHCVRSITQAIHTLDQDASVTIDLGTRRVDIGSPNVDAQSLAVAIKESGYTPVPVVISNVRDQAARRGCCCG